VQVMPMKSIFLRRVPAQKTALGRLWAGPNRAMGRPGQLSRCHTASTRTVIQMLSRAISASSSLSAAATIVST
jgi:hypothetical protein